MTMVGDAYAAPLVAELGRGGYDLSSLHSVATGGAATNPKYQAALLEYLPQITLINGYGSSETGNMGFGRSQGETRRDTFDLRAGDRWSHRTGPDSSDPVIPRSVGWYGPAGSRSAISTMPTRRDAPSERSMVSGW